MKQLSLAVNLLMLLQFVHLPLFSTKSEQ